MWDPYIYSLYIPITRLHNISVLLKCFVQRKKTYFFSFVTIWIFIFNINLLFPHCVLYFFLFFFTFFLFLYALYISFFPHFVFTRFSFFPLYFLPAHLFLSCRVRSHDIILGLGYGCLNSQMTAITWGQRTSTRFEMKRTAGRWRARACDY